MLYPDISYQSCDAPDQYDAWNNQRQLFHIAVDGHNLLLFFCVVYPKHCRHCDIVQAHYDVDRVDLAVFSVFWEALSYQLKSVGKYQVAKSKNPVCQVERRSLDELIYPC